MVKAWLKRRLGTRMCCIWCQRWWRSSWLDNTYTPCLLLMVCDVSTLIMNVMWDIMEILMMFSFIQNSNVKYRLLVVTEILWTHGLNPKNPRGLSPSLNLDWYEKWFHKDENYSCRRIPVLTPWSCFPCPSTIWLPAVIMNSGGMRGICQWRSQLSHCRS